MCRYRWDRIEEDVAELLSRADALRQLAYSLADNKDAQESVLYALDVLLSLAYSLQANEV